MNFMQIIAAFLLLSAVLRMLGIKSQWEIFILVINGRICIAENGSQVHGQHFSIFHGRFLIVYSSFGRVYRELLTCLKCSSHSNSFCSAFLLSVRLPPGKKRVEETFTTRQSRALRTSSGAFVPCLTSRWREARWWLLRDRDWQSTYTEHFLLLLVLLHVSISHISLAYCCFVATGIRRAFS